MCSRSRAVPYVLVRRYTETPRAALNERIFTVPDPSALGLRDDDGLVLFNFAGETGIEQQDFLQGRNAVEQQFKLFIRQSVHGGVFGIDIVRAEVIVRLIVGHAMTRGKHDHEVIDLRLLQPCFGFQDFRPGGLLVGQIQKMDDALYFRRCSSAL